MAKADKMTSLPMAPRKREQCPDCDQCQSCSPNRCRMCKKGGHQASPAGLGPSMTYGQYLEWKKKQALQDRTA